MKAKSGGGRPKLYKTSDGKRVPGVTTIISRFKDSGGLIHWAYTEGVEGRDYRETRDKAADSGTMFHDIAEADLTGATFEAAPGVPREVVDKAMNAAQQFRSWQDNTKVDVELTEMPYVNDALRVGGTLDGIGFAGGERALIDWKSSNGVYSEYIVQLGAYTMLWEAEHPDDKIETAHLVRFDKELEAWTHHRWGRPIIEKGARAFTLMRELYDIMKELKKAV